MTREHLGITMTFHKTLGDLHITVTMGYDPVFHRYFFVIEKSTDEEFPTYSNLDDNISEKDYRDISYFQLKAREHHVHDMIPDGNWEILERRLKDCD